MVLCFSSIAGAQKTGNTCIKSTEGREFWFGFMENRNYQVPQFPYYLQKVHYTEITLISDYQCNVDVYIGKSATPWKSITVYPNTPLSQEIPWQIVEAIGSEIPQDKAIHLVSDNPLNLYALNWCENSSDIAVIFPMESIGKEYFTMCYTPHIDSYFDLFGNEYYRSGRNSEFLVVATEDNTEVIINPSKNTDQGNIANFPFIVHLDKGELYQVQSLNHADLVGQGDLTGSHIQSNKPIAVFSGSLATTVPGEADVDAWDHLYEQMPPLQTWGRKFVTVPLVGRSKDIFRVMASQDNTNVRIGNITKIINKGGFFEFPLSKDEPALIESDHPVLLAQYMISNSVDRPANQTQYTWDGDPFMVLVSPVEQTRERVTFVGYKSNLINTKLYVNVVTRDDAVNQILLDGDPINFQSLPNSGYSFAQVQIQPVSHNLNSLEAGKGFIAYVYGYGGVESYGYGVGFNLNETLDLGGELSASGEKILTHCSGADPLTLDAGNGFKSYEWSTGETTSSIQVTTEGTYSVKVTTYEDCILEDVVRVLISNPIVGLGADRKICSPDVIELDAGSVDQFASFLWSTPDGTLTTQKITASKPGIYSVEATNDFGCIARDTIKIDYFPVPVIDLGPDRKVCYPDVFELDAGSAGQFATYLWNTPEGTSTTSKISVSEPDVYSVEATTVNSCIARDTIRIEYAARPVLDLSKIKTLVCGDFSTTLDVSSDIPGSTIALSCNNPLVTINGFTVSVAPENAGTYPITISASSDNFCETVETIDIGFYSTPTVGFTLQPDECLGKNENEISYVGTGSSLDTYQWDLSEFDNEEVIKNPGATPGPLVFILKSKPQASIGLQVVSQHNCPSEKASLVVRRKPVFSWEADPREGCAPLRVVFSAITGDPVDQLNYTWSFGDVLTQQGREITRDFPDPGQYSVSLNAVSSITGCSESLSEVNHILVNPNPEAGFSFNPGMAYNDQPNVTFLDESRDANRFFWDFGDGKTSDLQNPSHTYETVGIKTVLQTIYNQYNCSDTSSRQVTVAISKIFTPNAFSPNAANPVDREFKLYANGVMEGGYHLKILSRWNDVIFECKNVIKGWDGRLSNGKMAQTGNYIWILEFIDFLGTSHRQTGTVMLFY